MMLMLCFTWGFNQIAIKLVLPDIPPMLQAAIRSAGALPVLLLIGQLRGAKLFRRDGTLDLAYAVMLSTARIQSLIDRRNRAEAKDRAWFQ